MREILDKCREPGLTKDWKPEAVNTVLVVLLGAALGVIAKLIDNVPINDAIFWQRLLGMVDLRNVLSRLAIWALLGLAIAVFSKRPLRASLNVFCFFLAMMAGYYIVTITASGFSPQRYMIAWGTITLFTPIAAFFVWYAKGRGWLAVMVSAIIMGFFATQAFSFGRWYFYLSYYADAVCFVIALIVLFRDIKQLALTLAGAVVAAPVIKMCLPYIFGGL